MIWQQYKDQGLVAFAISSSTIGAEDPAQLADYADAMGLTMPVLVDYSPTLYENYRIEVPESFSPYPREYLVDRDGKLIYLSGTIDVGALAASIEAAL